MWPTRNVGTFCILALISSCLAASHAHRSGNHAAAEDAIEHVDDSGQTRVLLDFDVRVELCGADRPTHRVAVRAAGAANGLHLGALLDERVPGAAVGAAPEPL